MLSPDQQKKLLRLGKVLDGDVIARFASEVANSAIIAKAGSCVFYQQVI